MERKQKAKKMNVTCDNCKKKYNYDELLESGYIDEFDGFISIECPSCGDMWTHN